MIAQMGGGRLWYAWGVRVFAFSAVTVALVSSVVLAATPSSPLPVTADALRLARWADAHGDEALLAHLLPRVDSDGGGRPSAGVRWSAMLAAPYLQQPEAAIAPLCTIAGGRDPDLAPLAARTALRIVQGLSSDGLARRETTRAELGSAENACCLGLLRARPRADIRLMAEQVTAHLQQLTGRRCDDKDGTGGPSSKTGPALQ